MGIRNRISEWGLGLTLGATALSGAIGEAHGRNTVHDAAVDAQNTEVAGDAAKAAEARSVQEALQQQEKEAAERKIRLERTEKQISLAKSYDIQLSHANDSEREVVVKKILRDHNNWLATPSLDAIFVVRDIAKRFSSKEVNAMLDGDSSFYTNLSNLRSWEEGEIIAYNNMAGDSNPSFSEAGKSGAQHAREHIQNIDSLLY